MLNKQVKRTHFYEMLILQRVASVSKAKNSIAKETSTEYGLQLSNIATKFSMLAVPGNQLPTQQNTTDSQEFVQDRKRDRLFKVKLQTS